MLDLLCLWPKGVLEVRAPRFSIPVRKSLLKGYLATEVLVHLSLETEAKIFMLTNPGFPLASFCPGT